MPNGPAVHVNDWHGQHIRNIQCCRQNIGTEIAGADATLVDSKFFKQRVTQALGSAALDLLFVHLGIEHPPGVDTAQQLANCSFSG